MIGSGAGAPCGDESVHSPPLLQYVFTCFVRSAQETPPLRNGYDLGVNVTALACVGTTIMQYQWTVRLVDRNITRDNNKHALCLNRRVFPSI